MKINCPNCSTPYDVPAALVGQKFKCSKCEQEFVITNPLLQPCPDCLQMVSKRAVTCPHCGAPLKEPTPPVSAPTPHVDAAPQVPPPVFVSSGKPSLDQEEEILVCHPSRWNYFWGIVIGILTVVILIGIFILIYIWIDCKCTAYKITNLRVIVKRGWIAKLQNEIWIKDMRGANLSQGIWQRIIGIGNVSLGTAATAGTEICITGVSDPQRIVDVINSLRN